MSKRLTFMAFSLFLASCVFSSSQSYAWGRHDCCCQPEPVCETCECDCAPVVENNCYYLEEDLRAAKRTIDKLTDENNELRRKIIEMKQDQMSHHNEYKPVKKYHRGLW